MKLFNKIFNIFLRIFLAAGFIIILCNADMSAQNKRDVDERFTEARELAFSGDRQAAIDSCESILINYPDYHDVRVFMARVMAWNKNYDESIQNLKQVIEVKNDNREAINSLIDVYNWQGNYETALNYSEYGLTFYPTSPDFMVKKARMLNKLNRSEEAADVLTRLLDLYPANTEALKLESSLSTSALFNKLYLYYRSDLFPANTPWHLVYIEYARKFSFGTIIGRVNYTNRFNKSGIQFESDGYIGIRKGTYVYLNAGYSAASIFPKLRLGIEPYQMLPYAFEISLGLKYLDFTSSAIRIYTGSLGKYLGNYWISYRYYITPKPDKTSFSSALYIRKYFSDTDNYITLRLGVGLVSYSEIADEQFSGISSKGAGLDFQFNLSRLTFLKGEFNYGNHEYYKGKFRDRYGIKFGIQRRF